MAALDDLHQRVTVMAVVNRTPDSFYDRGRTFELSRAVDAAAEALDLGAAWVDVGGVPFGRGPEVSPDEEARRVLPLVEAVMAARPQAVVSVDTYRAHVARRAVDAGARVINDTSGFADPQMPDVLAHTGVHTVLCHSAGRPREEKPAPHYDDVVAQVTQFLTARLEQAVSAGVRRDRVVLDPGHDLDKNTLHSLELTRRLDEVVKIGPPVVAAVSNKDFIGESTDRPQGHRLAGSITAMSACVLAGARIVRMHDAAAAVDAARMLEAILGLRVPTRLEHNMHPTHNV